MATEKAHLGLSPYNSNTYSSSTPLATQISRDYDTTYNPTTQAWPVREYHFFKGNGLTSKARIQAPDGAEYRLVADIHKSKPSSIQIQGGKGHNTLSLGTVTFPPTHNNFDVRLPSMGPQTTQVKAKIGYPHPTAYEFMLPAIASPHPRKVVWKISASKSATYGYRLHDDFTNEVLASWNFVAGEKYQTALRWHVVPSSDWEEILVMLTFIGVLSRLKLKGKDHTGLPNSNMARWNGMWFMAIMGTAAMG